MERKRKLDVYESAPQGNGGGYGQQTAAPPAGDSGINPYNGRQYSQRYYQILSTRQGESGPCPQASMA
jgi:hypothetical protein